MAELSRRTFLQAAGASALTTTLLDGAESADARQALGRAQDAQRPNLLFVLVDNLGYGELGVYGGGATRGAPTPRIDRLASEGTRFTSFYVAQGVCTASRAGLMTGSYSNRVSLFGDEFLLQLRAQFLRQTVRHAAENPLT